MAVEQNLHKFITANIRKQQLQLTISQILFQISKFECKVGKNAFYKTYFASKLSSNLPFPEYV